MAYRVHVIKSEGSRKLVFNTSKKVVEYTLNEVTLKELFRHRLSGVAGVVYKEGEKLFYADFIDGTETCFSRINCNHICGKSSAECKYLSAKSDENGGCAKVRDSFVPSYYNKGSHVFVTGKMIEKYDFIEEGIEIFNSIHFLLNVVKCKNYKKVEPRTIDLTELTAPQKFWAECEEKSRKEALAKRYL